MSNIRMTFECESIAQLINELTQQLEALGGAMPEETESYTPQAIEEPPVQPKSEAVVLAAAPIAPPVATVAPAQAPMPAAVPTTATAYTLDQLIEAVSPIARDTAKIPQLQSLLNKYGVQGMMELPAEAYGAFATDIRAMGARI